MELARNQQHKMNDEQKRIAEWLAKQDSELGQLYEGAVRMIQDRSFPGRLWLVCHAVREIRNRLPEAVAGRGVVKRLEYSQVVDALEKAWERTGLGGVRLADGDEKRSEQKIPQEVVVLISDLVTKHKEVAGRKRENIKRLIITLEPENKDFQASLFPVINRLIEETDWFEERTCWKNY